MAAIWPDLDWCGHSPGGAGLGFYRFLVQLNLLILLHLQILYVNINSKLIFIPGQAREEKGLLGVD